MALNEDLKKKSRLQLHLKVGYQVVEEFTDNSLDQNCSIKN